MKSAVLARTDQPQTVDASPDRDCDTASRFVIRRVVPIALIVVVAFGLRLYLVTGPEDWTPFTIDTATGGYIQRGMKLSGNPGPAYDSVARNFLAGRGLVNDPGTRHPTRAPLYPLKVAGFYSMFGYSLLPIGIFQALLGALTCLLVWQAARMMSTEHVALLAAGMVAFMPEFLKYTPRLYESTLLVFLSSALVLVLLVARGRTSVWWAVAAGAIFGLLALTRLEMLVLVPFIAFWQFAYSSGSRRQRIGRVTITVLVLFLVISPWLVGNQTTDVDSLAEAGGGRLGWWLWGRLGPQAKTVWEDPPTGPRNAERGLGAVARITALEQLETEIGTGDEAMLDPHLKREAVDFMFRHPLRIVPLVLSRIMMLWNLWPTPPPPLPLFIGYWAFLALGIVAAVVWWRQPEMRLLVLIVIGITLFYGFLHGHPRYRLPASIPMIMMASVGLVHIWEDLKRRISANGL